MSEIKILDEATLCEMMPNSMVYRKIVTSGNIDNLLQTGIYILSGGTITSDNEPPIADWRLGVLEVLARDKEGVNAIHRITQIDSGNVVQRVRRGGVWKPWRLFSFSGGKSLHLFTERRVA